MLFESGHIAVNADHGTATLAFGFGGEPTNALNLAHLRELEAALDAVAACPYVRAIVIRSAIPAGFCGGLCPIAWQSLCHPADRSAFAWYGQQILNKIASLPAVTIVQIDGPCLGAGFELALACDRRICVSRPTTLLGFPDRFSFLGSSSRLRALAGRRGLALLASGKTISGREAHQMGLVDRTCSPRRTKSELRALLDQVEAHSSKSGHSVVSEGLAAERRAFSITQPPSVADPPTSRTTDNTTPTFPLKIGLLGNDAAIDDLAVAAALRGAAIVICGDRSGIFAGVVASAARGFLSPLEAEQVRLRVRSSETLDGFDNAELVFVAGGHSPFRLAAAIRPRTIVCVVHAPEGNHTKQSQPALPFPLPQRLIHLSFCGKNRVALFPGAATSAETLASVAEWLKPLGYGSVVFPVAARLLPRAA